MSQHERHMFERFEQLRAMQEELEQRGYYVYPVERELTEGLITGPLLNRIRTQIKKRGFEKVASHVAISFTGYADDPREIWQIPEVRSYWRQLDSELPELPALMADLPPLQFNGPGQHLLLLGDVTAIIEYPTMGGYDVQIADAPARLAEATRRIQQAGAKYHLSPMATNNLVAYFQQAATRRTPRPPRTEQP